MKLLDKWNDFCTDKLNSKGVNINTGTHSGHWPLKMWDPSCTQLESEGICDIATGAGISAYPGGNGGIQTIGYHITVAALILV